MAIEVMNDGEPRWMPAETCALCSEPTRYWYNPNDVAVCQSCAQNACDSDIPTKLEWLTANGAKERSADWAPNVETYAAKLVIHKDLVCMAKVVGVEGPAIEMMKAPVALMLLSAEREKSNISAQVMSDHIQSLEYIVGVYEARDEGKPIPLPYASPKQIEEPVVMTLAPDRIQRAVDVDSACKEPVEMMAVSHVRRFLSGEHSRARHIDFALKSKIESLRKELATYVQEGELA